MSYNFKTNKPRSLHLDPKTVLAEARYFTLQASHEPNGAVCPVCEQVVAIRPRSITPVLAEILCHMARHDDAHPGDWLDMGEFRAGIEWITGRTASQGGSYSWLKWWGLIERAPDSPRWRITSAGLSFTRGASRMIKTLLIRNDEPIGHVVGCGDVSIDDAINGRFDRRSIYSPGPTLRDIWDETPEPAPSNYYSRADLEELFNSI